MRRPWHSDALPDALLAAFIGVVGVLGTTGASHQQTDRIPLDALGYALIVLSSGVLAARRRWPLAVLGVVSLTILAYILLDYPYGPSMVPLVVAMYTVATRLPVGRSLAACGLAVAVLFVEAYGLVARGEFRRLLVVLPWAAWLVIPWAIGAVVRFVRLARDEANRERVYAERLRVAREVHDVVAHGLAAINMQAQIALHVLERKPDQARIALDAIDKSSRDALDELRHTLTMFRAADDGDGEGRAPVATLDELDRLVSRLAGSGLRVTVHIGGDRSPLPSTVDLAAYRIVQESLTNVLRHAGTASATVRIRYGPDELDIDVTDDGAGRPRPNGTRGGHGIAGMVERATALGGSLEAGPRPDGGFRVHATLPLRKVPA